MDAALLLLEGDRSFDSLSLREVTRDAGVVPAAFYRHFADMEQLGLALVEESFHTLRQLMRAARSAPVPERQLVHRSINTYVRYVRAHPTHFRFILRERFGGMASLRASIRAEIRLFVSELATDLSRFPNFNKWTTEDLQMVASLIVNAVVATTELTLDLPNHRPDEEAEVARLAERQLLLIFIAAPHWRSTPHPPAKAVRRYRESE